ncbi:MAG: VUT family protein [Yersinia sp. (in: enterobacteria)]
MIFIKKETANHITLFLLLSFSMTSHLIAYRLIDVVGLPVIPSSLTYMICFVIIDIAATFNNRGFLLFIIALETIANLIMLSITNIVTNMPAPEILINKGSYNDVFNPITTIYFANILGSLVAFSLDALIFFHLYNKKKMSFFESSIISSLIIVTIYTIITDCFAFKEMYPKNLVSITTVNIFTNLIFISILTVCAKYFITPLQTSKNK